MDRSRKRTKMMMDSDAISSRPSPRCYFTTLPLELIAEILSYTPSPRDILAVARTCKHFCAVLVNNPASEFIWRHSRARFIYGPIPDFSPNFTEASYAAFLFDSKICEVCKSKAKGAPLSVALRLVVCSNVTCRKALSRGILRLVRSEAKARYQHFLLGIPYMEDENLRGDWFRKSDWDAAVDEHRKAKLQGGTAWDTYKDNQQILANRLLVASEFFSRVQRWCNTYSSLKTGIANTNQQFANAFAQSIGITYRDLILTPTFNALHCAKNRSLEAFADADLQDLGDTVRAELAILRSKAARRVEESGRQRRLQQIQSTRDEMRASGDAPPILPNLKEFRNLPVVKVFEKTGPSRAAGSGLRDAFVESVLEENLGQWRDAARAALAGVLGVPAWRSMSKRKLHPVDRLTARFRCRRCDASRAAGPAAAKRIPEPEDGGMDFARACGHACGHLVRKRKARDRWSADRFVCDQKAADAISQVLALCGTTADSVDSIKIADELGDRVQCQACRLVMDVASVGRHCKRHLDASFALLPEGVNAEPGIEHGLADRLIQGSAAAAERDEKVYVCRHCAPPKDAAGGEAATTRLMSFNGLRSHVKEKHLIARIADEDFFRQKAPAVARDPEPMAMDSSA